VGRDHQVVPFDLDPVHRRDRKLLPQRLPPGAIVERRVDARLRAEEQQTLSLLVLADRPRKIIGGNAGDDLRPRLAEVRGLVDVRSTVGTLVAVGCEIRSPSRVWRRLDQADASVFRQIRGRDFLPRLAGVPRDMDEAVIRPCPDDVAVDRTRSEGEDRRVSFHAGLIERDRTAAGPEGRRIVPRQVRADARPALSFIDRSPDML
jgi:hypothetical protein